MNENLHKKTVLQRLRNMGPGAIVSAALIGPGTITTCGLAGFNYSYALAWALLFSVIAMVITQRMTAKIGLISGMGLAAAIREAFRRSVWRWPLFILIILAIFVGNCAYQASNVVGASTGMTIIFGPNRAIYCVIISAAALALILSGSIKYISKVLTAVVFLMVVLFLITAIIVKPDMGAVFSSLLIPRIPSGSQITTIALIGTTMTPYCIYLHSDSHASTKLENPDMDVDDALIDNAYSSVTNAILMLCVSVSVMIVGCSLALRGESVKSVSDLALGLTPLAGVWASYIFAVGIFAAGISSATTAPLAATYVICGILGWSTDLKDKRFRLIATIVFTLGCVVAITGGTPTSIITIAQAIGGVALPLSIILVVYIANKEQILDKYVNKQILNILSILVLVISLFMTYRTIVVYAPQIVAWFA